MASTSFQVLGVHPYVPTPRVFAEALEWRYGTDLEPDELAEAEAELRAHFAELYLIEVAGAELAGDFPFGEITQQQPAVPRDQWQVPYDERALDEAKTRWAFFFHYLDRDRPLLTPQGPVRLPGVTPLPPHLREVIYEAP